MKYKTEMQKIKRYSHSVRIVVNVFYWAAVIFAIGSLISVGVIKFLSESHFLITQGSIGHIGFMLNSIIKYNINDVSLEGISLKNVYLTIMLMSTVIFSLLIPVLKQLVLILKTVEENKPFTVVNAKRLTMFGFVLFIGSALIPAIEVLVANTIINALKIQNVSAEYSVNLYLVAAGFLMIILGGIFRYGSYLQYEYDETV